MKNPISIEAFADWCDKQSADRVYDYKNGHECAFAQYLVALGFMPCVNEEAYCLDHLLMTKDLSAWRPLPFGLDLAVYEFPRTFGALAGRLRAACAEPVAAACADLFAAS